MEQFNRKILFRISFFTCLLAFVVIMLGAYTRLKDAGLGCPDWPGCYGHLTVPSAETVLAENPHQWQGALPVEPIKAWAEMVHRYFAGTLSLLILAINFFAWRRFLKTGDKPIVPSLLLAVLVFQAVLGMWTVTWLLYPLVVMSHLLGGITLLCLLWWYTLSMSDWFKVNAVRPLCSYQFWAALGFVIVFLQVMLGGWTSSNYAALACPNFPLCHGTFWPHMDFRQALLVPLAFGPNYQGGVLDMTGRITIQMLHRYGAFITLFYVGILSFWQWLKPPKPSIARIAEFIWIILGTQFILGVLNVVWKLPIQIAVAHNGVAALLLLSLITLNYALHAKSSPR